MHLEMVCSPFQLRVMVVESEDGECNTVELALHLMVPSVQAGKVSVSSHAQIDL